MDRGVWHPVRIDPNKKLLAVLMVQLAPLSPGNPLAALYWQRMRELVYGALADND